MQLRNTLNLIFCAFTIILFLKCVPTLYDVFALVSVSLLGIKLADFLITYKRKYIWRKTVCPKRKAVLITGCGSGIGNALAKRMDKIGYKVFAACLNTERAGARDLAMNCSEKLTVIPMNVRDDQSVEEAKEYVTRNLGEYELWAVVNNAGISHFGEVDWTTLQELQAVFDVNAIGPLRVTKAFLPLLKESKGRIVNNTSFTGRVHVPYLVGYIMSKSAAVAMTTGLRIEFAKWGVKAINIEAFFYSTRLTSIKSMLDLVDKAWKAAPEDIKKEYGEEYIEAFKMKGTKHLNQFSNPRICEVIDCFEDAITAVEPLSTYFPCQLIYKAGVTLFLELPIDIKEYFMAKLQDVGITPSALMRDKYNKK